MSGRAKAILLAVAFGLALGACGLYCAQTYGPRSAVDWSPE